MIKIDFSDKDFKFISKPDEYFIEGEVLCEGDFTEWKPGKKIEEGWGMFRGMTMEGSIGYIGELPRLDGDTSTFEEFTILYKGIDVSQMTYSDLSALITSEKREYKINDLGIT